MQYYTYKITFKDLPGYFYYGRHKCKGRPYFGSPVTWSFLWLCFEPEIQILQWYETAEEVDAAEESIIRATWDSKYSLNEHYGGRFSEDACTRGGKQSGPANAKAMNDHPSTKEIQKCEVLNAHPNTVAVRSDNGKITGPSNAVSNFTPEACSAGGKVGGKKNAKALNSHPNTKEARDFRNKRGSKPVACLETGLQYPSIHEVQAKFGISRAHVKRSCRTGCRAGGFHWQFMS